MDKNLVNSKQFFFRKIKNKDDKIHLEYFIEKQNGLIDEYSCVSNEKAAPSFYNAFLSLRKHVLDICEMPMTDEEIVKVTVTSVSFSYSTEDKIMGAVITAQKKLRYSNSPLNLNTPFKPETTYNDSMTENNLLPAGCVNCLYDLIAEAKAYLLGDREQIDLFSNDTCVDQKGSLIHKQKVIA